ncbi:MAG: MBL fold metallo-hydrolase, partial [bacterium]|nr:MBL fold metallo-hydrolase [bacterium]
LGFMENYNTPTLKVSEWWAPDSQTDLGGRILTVIHAPGHSPDSIVLFDRKRNLLFTGDFIYPGGLLAVLPGSSLKSYLSTAQRAVDILPLESTLLTAHRDMQSERFGAPVLKYMDLVDLRNTVKQIVDSTLEGEGIYISSYRINNRIELLSDW